MSLTSCLELPLPSPLLPPTRRSPMLAANASSRAYRGTCALAAQREFLRIADVTDSISEHIMCFRDTESENDGALWIFGVFSTIARTPPIDIGLGVLKSEHDSPKRLLKALGACLCGVSACHFLGT